MTTEPDDDDILAVELAAAEEERQRTSGHPPSPFSVNPSVGKLQGHDKGKPAHQLR
jgi:hypothetical protein